MVLRHAIIEATVPNSNGTVDYTAPGISNWSGGGLALIFASGDTGALTFGGWCNVGLVDSSGAQLCSGMQSADDATGLPENRTCDVNDHAVILLDNLGGTGFGVLARAQWSASLSNGVRLNWVDTAGVGARTFKLVILLVEGFAGVAARQGGSNTFGFQADALLSYANGNGSFSAYPPSSRNANECCPGLGAALRLGGIPQVSAYVCNDRNQDPLVSRGGRRTADFNASADGITQRVATVTAFGASAITVSGTHRGGYFAMRSSGPGDYGAALEHLDGTTGLKHLTGLGARFGVVVGFVCGVTSDDTFEADSAALAPFAFFVTDGVTTISLGFSQRHNGTAISTSNHTDTYSSYSNTSVKMLDHLNATAFLATVVSLTSNGLDLNVTTGLSGTMFLFGIATQSVTENPDPVPLPLTTGVVKIGGLENPTPVPLPLVAPAVQVQAAHRPAAVALPLALGVPTVLTPPVLPTPLVPPDLGPAYRAALADLLPRGLAWPRRSS